MNHQRLIGIVLVVFLLGGCQLPPAISLDGDRKEVLGPVELPPDTEPVAAPAERLPAAPLTTLVQGGKALQYYSLENATGKKAAFLTFDDFGATANLSELLAVLDKYNAKATFFVNCRYLDPSNALYSSSYLTWMRRLQSKGHTLANHSYSHFSQGASWYNYYRDRPIILPNGKLSPPPGTAAQAYTYHYGYLRGLELLKNEIDACDNIMNAHGLAAYDPIFRPPYGEHVPVLDTALAQAGYSTSQVLNWDVTTCDYDNRTTAEEIRDAILLGVMPSVCAENKTIVTRPLRHGDIVLMHWSKSSSNNTAEGLALALAKLSSTFTFPALQNESSDY